MQFRRRMRAVWDRFRATEPAQTEVPDKGPIPVPPPVPPVREVRLATGEVWTFPEDPLA